MPTWEADNPILQRRLGSAGVALIYFRATQISETTYLVDLDKWACSPFWSSLVFSRTQSFSSLLCLYALSTVYYGFTKMGAWKMLKNRIREYRAKYDMKQEDLAKLVGVRREKIGKLEKGIHNPSLVLAWNIAKAFNISIEDIFTVESSSYIDK